MCGVTFNLHSQKFTTPSDSLEKKGEFFSEFNKIEIHKTLLMNI